MGINISFSRRVVVSVSALMALSGGSLFLMRASAVPGTPKDAAPMGKITPWQAMKIATGNTPGKPIQAIFEYEDNRWHYGVVVVRGKTLYEVEIDATTGKVGDSEVITSEGEGKEMAQELNAAIGKRSARKPEGKEADEKGEKE
jgi:hypothetical protein